MGLKVVTRRRYLGKFSGNKGAEAMWLEEKVEVWSELVQTLLGVALWKLQTAYADMQKSL